MNTNNRIDFQRPDLHELARSHTVMDMHLHSRHSDGLNTVRAIARRAHRLGIGVAITDHNAIAGAVEIDRDPNLLSIPGIEVTSVEGSHLLIYFYDVKSLGRFYESNVKPFMGSGLMSSLSLDMETIIERARRYRSVVIFPHPYCAAYTGVCNLQFPEDRLNRLLALVDGVEVINAGNLNRWNMQCAVLGFNLDKAITGGSDGHALGHIGRAVTYFSGDAGRKAFLDAIIEKRVKVMGKEMNFFRKVTTNGSKLRPNLRYYPDLMEKNIRYGYSFINSKSKRLKENVRRSFNGKA
ncbi:MAG: PHP domain-containing protein [Deltaproteobacteria bacterium]|nr:PHP domain-containing protein [Deltaproteobacteria bacterium]